MTTADPTQQPTRPGWFSFTGVAIGWILFALLLPAQVLSISNTNSLILLGTVLVMVVLMTRMKVPVALIFVLLAYMLAMIVAMLLQEHRHTTKDLLEIAKPLFWFSAFGCGYFIALRHDRFIERVVIPLALFQVAFSFIIFVPALYPIADIFKGRDSSGALFVHFLRFTGTFAFPIELALFLGFVATLIFGRYLREPRLFTLIALGFVIFGLLFTASRGGLILTILVFGLRALRNIRNPASLYLGMLSVGGAAFILSQYAELLGYLLQSGIDIFSDGSYRYRLRELHITLEQLANNPWFGSGPSNEYYSSNYGPIESLLLSVLGRYGLVGATLFAVLMSFFLVWRARSEMERGAKLFFIIAITVGAITVSAVEQPKSALAMLSVIGYVARRSAIERRNEISSRI